MKKTTKINYQQRVLDTQLYVERHLDDALTLDTLAKVACFSAYHFHRIFRGISGESVQDYIRRLRLERAVSQLVYSDQSVLNIALQAGYQTHEAFTRAVKKYFHHSPSAIRKLPSFDPQSFRSEQQPVEDMTMQVDIKMMKPIHVAFVRRVGAYNKSAEGFETVAKWCHERQLFNADTRCIGVYYDDPAVTPEDKLRYDACFSAGENVRGEGEVGIQDIRGGRYAVVRLVGSYEQIPGAYNWLFGQWLPNSGEELADAPPFDIYIGNPRETKQEELIAEIHVPLV